MNSLSNKDSNRSEMSIGLTKVLMNFDDINERLSELESLVQESRYEIVLKKVSDLGDFNHDDLKDQFNEYKILLENCALIRNPQKCYSSIKLMREFCSQNLK